MCHNFNNLNQEKLWLVCTFSGFSITLLQVDQCVDLSQVLLLNGEIAVWQ